jgi:hypothetical protein
LLGSHFDPQVVDAFLAFVGDHVPGRRLIGGRHRPRIPAAQAFILRGAPGSGLNGSVLEPGSGLDRFGT